MFKKGTTGIYKITSPTGRIYIGQSINIESRFYHYKLLRCESQIKLYNSLNKHGVKSHTFEIIEICSIDKLNEREYYWQMYYNSIKNGLNCIINHPNKEKYIPTMSFRKKLSEINTGEGNPNWGKRGKLSPHYGVKVKESTKELLRKANLGKKYPEHVNIKKGRKGTENPFYGRKHDEKLIRRMTVAQSNRVLIIENGVETIFECVSDCANYFKCTTKNILFRDKQRKKGIKSHFGMFKGIYLEILK